MRFLKVLSLRPSCAAASVLPSPHTASRFLQSCSRTGGRVGFQLLRWWLRRSNLIKMCSFETWLLLTLPARRRRLMPVHLEPECGAVRTCRGQLLAFAFCACFTFRWTLPSAASAVWLEMTHKCWLKREALCAELRLRLRRLRAPPVSAWRECWLLIQRNKAFYTRVLKDHFTQNLRTHCPLMP